MALSTQPYKGARDFYPEDKRIQNYMFNEMRKVCERFGYEEYDAPILEPLELFAAKTGQEIVNEQTYTFEDRGGRQVAIRPEMTPTVSRMVAARRQELAYPARLYSIPNFWRYERPQRGRLREFWQLNVDVFGIDNVSAELEMIQLMDGVLKEFGAKETMYQIRLNSRKLVDYIMGSYFGFDATTSNDVIKLIDRMNKLEPAQFKKQLADIVGKKTVQVEELLKAKTISDLPEVLKELQSVSELDAVLTTLNDLGISNVEFDITLMRGFDYYTDIVFEVFDTNPANNRSMFGGGRYDGLVGLFGVEPVPTVGFAMGDVTLQNFLESNGLLPRLDPETQLVAIILGDNYLAAQAPIEQLRKDGLNIAVDATGRKLDKQLKSAVKQGVRYCVIIGDNELKANKFMLKNLNTTNSKELSVGEISEAIKVNDSL